MNKLLTVGMATYDDYHGTYFTIQSLRMYQPIFDTDSVEIVVLDNNPNGAHGKALKGFVENWTNGKGKYVGYESVSSTWNRFKILDHANGKYILIMDCHVLLARDSIKHLLNYFSNNPNCKDLVQGPLLYDDLKNYSTEFSPVWRDSMYGTWHTNKESYDKGLPFEIQLQGLGVFAFEKENFPTIPQEYFRGFGGEEGYIAEKFRQNGGKNICLPQLKWVHRFGRPDGVKYPLSLEDRVWNYFIGWLDITKDPNHQMIQDIYNHFKDKMSQQSLDSLKNQAIKLIIR